ncbi:MAG: RNA-binding protein [Oscillatoriales cyanobacterium SM2_1_8]|nr:RNA-binding protein [Oscillatoriales cyanobacterium SM2_1_8]
MSIRLYVGNLSAECDRQALEQIFHQSWDHLALKLVMDRKTGKCRGFGFVTVETDELADAVIEKFNGYEFEGTAIKLEKALPRTKGNGEGNGERGGEEGDEGSRGEKGELEGGEARPRVPRPVKRSVASESAVVASTVIAKTVADGSEEGSSRDRSESEADRGAEGGAGGGADSKAAISLPQEGGDRAPSNRQKKPRSGRPNKDSGKEYRESDTQPDPRWASELEQLKQKLLATQS